MLGGRVIIVGDVCPCRGMGRWNVYACVHWASQDSGAIRWQQTCTQLVPLKVILMIGSGEVRLLLDCFIADLVQWIVNRAMQVCLFLEAQGKIMSVFFVLIIMIFGRDSSFLVAGCDWPGKWYNRLSRANNWSILANLRLHSGWCQGILGCISVSLRRGI